VQPHKKEVNRATEHEESVAQFNLIGFVDDLSLFAQTLGGAQALLGAIREFELWCGSKVNRKKLCGMVVERLGAGQHQMSETLVYMGQEVTFLAPSASTRYLGVWGTPTGDMSDTKERIFRRTEEARDLLRHHPLTPEHEAVWVQAYKWTWGLPWTTASDVFTLPSGTAGMEYPRPVGEHVRCRGPW
jgi:hypothetical protein